MHRNNATLEQSEQHTSTLVGLVVGVPVADGGVAGVCSPEANQRIVVWKTLEQQVAQVVAVHSVTCSCHYKAGPDNIGPPLDGICTH